MPISVPCMCGRVVAAPDTLAGREVQCPSCGAHLEVGKAAAGAAPPAPVPPIPAARVPSVSSPTPRLPPARVPTPRKLAPTPAEAKLRGASPRMTVTPDELARGRPFGRYVLLDEVGHGGMGTVYRAWQTDLHRVVAVKTLRALAGASDSDLNKRLLREARAAGRLRHANIIAIHEVGEHEGIPFIAMDFIDGISLAKRMEKPILPHDAVRVVVQAARAVGYAHENGIVHRDLKPSNIMLERGGRIVLMDFGIAKDLDPGRMEPTLTEAGSLLGSPPYMSPEQVTQGSDKVDPRSDVYSLGVMLYELIAGRRPFEANSVGMLFVKIAKEAPPRLRPEQFGVPAAIGNVVHRSLEKNPDRRWPTAGVFADALEKGMLGQSVPTPPAPASRGPALEPPRPARAGGGVSDLPFSARRPGALVRTGTWLVTAWGRKGFKWAVAAVFVLGIPYLMWRVLTEHAWRVLFQNDDLDGAIEALRKTPGSDSDARRWISRLTVEKVCRSTRSGAVANGRSIAVIGSTLVQGARPVLYLKVSIAAEEDVGRITSDDFYLRTFSRGRTYSLNDPAMAGAFSTERLGRGQSVLWTLAFTMDRLPDLEATYDLFHNDGTAYATLRLPSAFQDALNTDFLSKGDWPIGFGAAGREPTTGGGVGGASGPGTNPPTNGTPSGGGTAAPVVVFPAKGSPGARPAGAGQAPMVLVNDSPAWIEAILDGMSHLRVAGNQVGALLLGSGEYRIRFKVGDRLTNEWAWTPGPALGLKFHFFADGALPIPKAGDPAEGVEWLIDRPDRDDVVESFRMRLKDDWKAGGLAYGAVRLCKRDGKLTWAPQVALFRKDNRRVRGVVDPVRSYTVNWFRGEGALQIAQGLENLRDVQAWEPGREPFPTASVEGPPAGRVQVRMGGELVADVGPDEFREFPLAVDHTKLHFTWRGDQTWEHEFDARTPWRYAFAFDRVYQWVPRAAGAPPLGTADGPAWPVDPRARVEDGALNCTFFRDLVVQHKADLRAAPPPLKVIERDGFLYLPPPVERAIGIYTDGWFGGGVGVGGFDRPGRAGVRQWPRRYWLRVGKGDALWVEIPEVGHEESQ